jgi:hypothetical protein
MQSSKGSGASKGNVTPDVTELMCLHDVECAGSHQPGTATARGIPDRLPESEQMIASMEQNQSVGNMGS